MDDNISRILNIKKSDGIYLFALHLYSYFLDLQCVARLSRSAGTYQIEDFMTRFGRGVNRMSATKI